MHHSMSKFPSPGGLRRAHEKKPCNAFSVSGSIKHSIFWPRLSIRMRPAWRSSLMWCEIVEGTMPRSSPNSPTQAHPGIPVLGLMLATVPGWQQAARRMKIFSRLGFERALKISAYCSILMSRLFGMYRTIINLLPSVKPSFGEINTDETGLLHQLCVRAF